MNRPEIVRLPRRIVNLILRHAQDHPSEEVCGLIGARDATATSVYPIANVAAQPHCRYIMDPRGQIEAMRRLREQGERLFAIYHSHPASAALPSPTDIAEACYEDAFYLIISLDTRGVLEMRAFRLADGRAEEHPLELAS